MTSTLLKHELFSVGLVLLLTKISFSLTKVLTRENSETVFLDVVFCEQTKPKHAIGNLVDDFFIICMQVSILTKSVDFHELMEKLYISWKLPIQNELN